MDALEIVGEPLLVNDLAKGKALEEQVAELLRRVGLRPEYPARRHPHAFMRRRASAHRMPARSPRVRGCCRREPVSALDVSVRAQTLNLLRDLQSEFHLTYLFILRTI